MVHLVLSNPGKLYGSFKLHPRVFIDLLNLAAVYWCNKLCLISRLVQLKDFSWHHLELEILSLNQEHRE